MAQRPIDRLAQHILDASYLDEVDKHIILARIYIKPSEGEIMQAKERAEKSKNVSA